MDKNTIQNRMGRIVKEVQQTTGIAFRKDEMLTIATGCVVPDMGYFYECFEDLYEEELRELSIAELIQQKYGEWTLGLFVELFELIAMSFKMEAHFQISK